MGIKENWRECKRLAAEFAAQVNGVVREHDIIGLAEVYPASYERWEQEAEEYEKALLLDREEGPNTETDHNMFTGDWIGKGNRTGATIRWWWAEGIAPVGHGMDCDDKDGHYSAFGSEVLEKDPPEQPSSIKVWQARSDGIRTAPSLDALYS